MSVAPGSTANSVNVMFTNFSDLGSSITEIYFDDGTLLGLASVADPGASVQFPQVVSGNPSSLPGGNNVTPAAWKTRSAAACRRSSGSTSRCSGGAPTPTR
jgi:hypothetical protein